MVVQAPKNCHITPVLRDLHWLPIQARIEYKILLTVFKALNGLAPAYIEQLLNKRQNSSRSTRLNSNNVLTVPTRKEMTVTWGERNFRFCAPYLWNKLPSSMRTCEGLSQFKSQLKTLLFRQTFEQFYAYHFYKCHLIFHYCDRHFTFLLMLFMYCHAF